MSSPLTVGERILLHLRLFSKYQDDYDVPFDVSQDGIASALRISRAHAAIELKKLKEGGDVSERLAHIRKGKTRRKVYFLSPMGEEKGRRIREFAEKEGIDVKPLLDIRRCTGDELWGSLNEELRAILCKACAFRKPFRRDALPDVGLSILPVDRSGMVEIPSELRVSIHQLMDERERRDCHSFAADYWLREGDHVERLHHLVLAGRTKEAEMLISRRAEELLKHADEDLHSTCSCLPEASSRYRSKVNRFRAEVAIETGHYEDCIEMIGRLRGGDRSDEFYATMLQGRVSLRSGDLEGALESLLDARKLVEGVSMPLEIEISRTLVQSSRYGEARELLEGLLPTVADEGDGGMLVEIQYLLGISALRAGDAFDAIKYLSKGMGASPEEDRSRWFIALSEAYMAMGMGEKAEEYRSMVPRSTRWNSASAYQGR